MCREDVPLFWVSFSELVLVFFNSPMPFWVDFTNIGIFFAVFYAYFIRESNSVLGTKFL